MNHDPPSWSRQAYSVLLRCYPRSVRERFGSEMFQLFSDSWRDRKRAGQRHVFMRMWARTFRDAVVNGWILRFGRRRTNGALSSGSRSTNWGETILRDLKHALRSLQRAPLFSSVVVVTFTLGIGVNSAIFSVVDGVLIRPLPFPEPEQLVRVWSLDPNGGNRFLRSTFAEVSGVAEESRSFWAVAAYSLAPSRMLDGYSTPETIVLARLTGDLPGVLGARPVVGRGFTAADFRSDGRVVLLSHGLWQRRYGGEQSVVGTSTSLRGEDLVIIGVLPETFGYPITAEAWRPFPADAYQDDDRELETIARLNGSSSPEQATADVRLVMAGLRERGADPEEVLSAWVQPLHGMVVHSVRTPLLVLLGSVGMVLLICCVNVANLFLARMKSRQPEISLRTALGASRRRLIQSLLMEAIVLGGLGCTFGLLLGRWLLQGIVTWTPAHTPRLAEVTLDLRIVAVMALVSVGVSVASSFLPALRFATLDVGGSLGGRAMHGAGGRERTHLQQALVVAEVSLSTTLAFGAALFLGTFVNLLSFDRGFVTERLLSVPVSIADNHRSVENVRAFYHAIADGVRRLPGASAVALSFRSPLDPFGLRWPVRLHAGQSVEGADAPNPFLRSVSPEYFATVGIPITRGRGFQASDDAEAPPVGIVNETFVRQHFQGGNPVGQRLHDDDGSLEIVGVVGDVRPTVDAVVSPALYRPFDQITVPSNHLMVRTVTPPADMVRSIRSIIWSIDPTVALDDIATIDQALSESVAAPRFIMLLTGGFAALALGLAAVGVYGVMSYSVASRTRELGLRQALGASPRTVLSGVLMEGARITMLGILLGLAVTVASERFVRGLLYGVDVRSPVVLTGVVTTLALVSIGAVFLPALRAVRIAPLIALRNDG